MLPEAVFHKEPYKFEKAPLVVIAMTCPIERANDLDLQVCQRLSYNLWPDVAL